MKKYWAKILGPRRSHFLFFSEIFLCIFVFISEWQNAYWFSKIVSLNGQKISTRSLILWKNKRKRKNEKSWKNWCPSLWSAPTRISCKSRFYVKNENIKIFTVSYRRTFYCNNLLNKRRNKNIIQPFISKLRSD